MLQEYDSPREFGYLPKPISPRDWLLGGQGDWFSPLNSKPLISGNNWERWLPVVEFQNRGGFDRMACVTYSDMNFLEVLHIHATGREANFSDRYIAKLSGTTRRGNYVTTVFDAIREYGLVNESDWPDVSTSWDDYYKDVPQSLINKGKNYIKDWDIYREFIAPTNRDLIFDALNHAPLQVIVKYAAGDGILNPVGDHDHAVMCYGAEYKKSWLIFDHYTQTRKKYAWDYEFGCVLKPTFKLKTISMFKPKNGHLYLLVEGKEQKLGMGLDGKLVIYPDKVDAILNSASRLGEFVAPTPLTLKDWETASKTNGKGETL